METTENEAISNPANNTFGTSSEFQRMMDQYAGRNSFQSSASNFGGGVGISRQDYTVETLGSGSDSSPSWQVLVGFEKMHTSPYLFAAFPSPFVQYRFLRITEGDFGVFKADASLHLFEFGFRFYEGFGS